MQDVARAFDMICHRGRISQAYNIGTDFERAIQEMAHYYHQLVEKWGYMGADIDQHRIAYGSNRPCNDCRYTIKRDKLAALGWTKRRCRGGRGGDGLKSTISRGTRGTAADGAASTPPWCRTRALVCRPRRTCRPSRRTCSPARAVPHPLSRSIGTAPPLPFLIHPIPSTHPTPVSFEALHARDRA